MSYVILMGGNDNAWIIDPGDIDFIISWIEGRQKKISSVFITHGHFDHIYGLNKLLEGYPDCVVYTNDYGKDTLKNEKKNMSKYNGSPFVFEYPNQVRVVNDCNEVDLGNGFVAKAVFTPGHNPSCITWVINDMVFSGDSLIPGIKTVTNLPGGNRQQALESEKLILKLAENRTIYPGHAVCSKQADYSQLI